MFAHETRAEFILGDSSCETPRVKDLLALEKSAEREFKKLPIYYGEENGHPELRKEIGKLYRKVGAKDVWTSSGSEEAIFAFLNVILERRDHVIAQSPGYGSFMGIPKYLGCDVTEWKLKKGKWDLEVLKKSIRKRTRVIIINSPHNPTGYTFTREELDEIIRIAKRKRIYVLSDEVYRFMEYEKKDRLPAVCDLYHRGVSLGSVSKFLGMGGARIGWAATKDHHLLKRMGQFKSYTTITNSVPSEFLTTLALRNRDILLERNMKIITRNLKKLEKFFEKYQDFFVWHRPKSGPIAFPKIKPAIKADQFCETLFKRDKVLLVPSTMFNFGNKHFRIGFGCRDFHRAIAKLDDHIQHYYYP